MGKRLSNGADSKGVVYSSFLQTFGADEAPADVDVAVVAVALLGVEVVGADNGRVRDHLAACSHAQVADVVRHRTAKAAHQPT